METLTQKRPDRKDPEIISAVVARLAPKVVEWYQGDADEIDDVADDLSKALCWHSNGYELARELDSCEPDAALVEILDGAGNIIYSEHQKACIAWVEANGLKGPEIGTQVKHKRGGEELGTITRNWPEGRSTVAFPSLGHITEGDGIGCHGFILEWETLILG